MTTGTYLVCCPTQQLSQVCDSPIEANVLAWDWHGDSGDYVWVEDYLGHTYVEYGECY